MHNTPNKPFRTKNIFEINYDARGTYDTKNQIKFYTTMLRSSLYDYSDAYIVKGTITAENIWTAANPNNRTKEIIIKDYAPVTDFISEINKTQVDTAEDVDVVIHLYNLIEYRNNYLKI